MAGTLPVDSLRAAAITALRPRFGAELASGLRCGSDHQQGASPGALPYPLTSAAASTAPREVEVPEKAAFKLAVEIRSPSLLRAETRAGSHSQLRGSGAHEANAPLGRAAPCRDRVRRRTLGRVRFHRVPGARLHLLPLAAPPGASTLHPVPGRHVVRSSVIRLPPADAHLQFARAEAHDGGFAVAARAWGGFQK